MRAHVIITSPDHVPVSFVETMESGEILDIAANLVESLRHGCALRVSNFDRADECWWFEVRRAGK